MVYKLVSFIIVLAVITGCQTKQFQSADELEAYLLSEDSDLSVSKKVKGIDFTLTYRPTDLLVNQSLSSNANTETIDSLRSFYKQFTYYILDISVNNSQIDTYQLEDDEQSLYNRSNTLAFGLQSKLAAVSSNDTVYSIDYLYDRQYGAGTSSRGLFVFNREEIEKSDQFILDEFGLNIGKVHFNLVTPNPSNEPKISFH